MSKNLKKTSIFILIALTIPTFFYITKTDTKEDAIIIENDETQEVQIPVISEKQTPQEKSISPELISDMVKKETISNENLNVLINNLPASLANSAKPLDLDVDYDGNLIINTKIKNLFEFYLIALGEEDLDTVIIRIKHSLNTQLSGNALDEANYILEGYLQYRNNIANIKNRYNVNYQNIDYSISTVKEMKEEVINSRTAYFSSDVADAFFSKEDEYETYTMNKMEITSNKDYSEEYKKELIQELNYNSPQWIFEEIERSDINENNRKTEKQLITSGASKEEIQYFREEAYGLEAAERKKELDKKRADWDRKINVYKEELKKIIELPEQYNDTKKEMINELRQRYFNNERELKRIDAIDNIKY